MGFNIQQWLIDLALGAVGAFGDASEEVELVDSPTGTGALALVRDGYTLKPLLGPERLSRIHRFGDLESFAAWLNRHGAPGNEGDESGGAAKARQAVEILMDHTKAEAALTPQTIDTDRVECHIQEHARAVRWTKLFGGVELTQRELHYLFIATSDDFQRMEDAEGGDLGGYGEVLAAEIAKIEIADSGTFESHLDASGTLVFQGTSKKTTIPGKLPARFKIIIPLIHGVYGEDHDDECVYELDVLLRTTVKDGVPTFQLACPGLDTAKRAALADAVAWLRSLLDGGFLVGMGSLNMKRVPVYSS